ncbi:MAG TPA: fluoride efflux transporter CrcB [Actinomycetota bacterium]|nr:fluoride efflux transporter CrcB [Actinomycetota bacterium]
MRTALAIAVAGAIGALARWGVGTWFGQRFPTFPWGTLVVNVSGSFLLGLLFAVLIERAGGSPTMRIALTTGLMGAYTTFSTFSLETFRLLEDGATGSAVANIGLSLVLGLGAVWIGIGLGRAVT